MGFLQKAVSAMVTKYGKVVDGKYEGHFLCLGHDPEEQAKPQVVNALAPKCFKQVIFMMDDEGKARHDICADIARASRIDEDDTTFTLNVVWKSGEESTFRLFKEKAANEEQSGLSKGIGILMKMGGTTKNSDTPELKAKERYGDFVDFMYSMMFCMDLDTLECFEDFVNELGYVPEACMAVIEKAIAMARQREEQEADEDEDEDFE